MKVSISDYPESNVSVQIDPHDTWNMDITLSYIILPMLKQLRDTSQGSPCTSDQDVPEELKSTSAPPKDNDYDTDDNHHLRWDWVLGEMIWAFDQKVTGFEPCFLSASSEYDKHQDRMSNGFLLFGKYYEGLWD